MVYCMVGHELNHGDGDGDKSILKYLLEENESGGRIE